MTHMTGCSELHYVCESTYLNSLPIFCQTQCAGFRFNFLAEARGKVEYAQCNAWNTYLKRLKTFHLGSFSSLNEAPLYAEWVSSIYTSQMDASIGHEDWKMVNHLMHSMSRIRIFRIAYRMSDFTCSFPDKIELIWRPLDRLEHDVIPNLTYLDNPVSVSIPSHYEFLKSELRTMVHSLMQMDCWRDPSYQFHVYATLKQANQTLYTLWDAVCQGLNDTACLMKWGDHGVPRGEENDEKTEGVTSE